MNHELFANEILDVLRKPPVDLPSIINEETRRNNAARCMVDLFCNRLSSNGEAPEQFKRTTFEWKNGLVSLRNSRIAGHFWSNIQTNAAKELHQEATKKPVVYILAYWAISNGKIHFWVLPENVAYMAFDEIPVGSEGTYKSVELFQGTNSLKNAPNAPDLSPYYLQCDLLQGEVNRLVESIKFDHAAKISSQEEEVEVDDDNSESFDDKGIPFFTSATVDFLKDLTDHTQDANWHEEQKTRYQQVLRNPVRSFVEALRNEYIESLSPEVAGGRNQLSILKKNDYGKGGYYDYFWFAFYDPDAGSKTKSVQLFFTMIGSEQIWRYGFSMGSYCDEYLERLQTAFESNPRDVANYIRNAPPQSQVELWYGEEKARFEPNQFAEILESSSSERLEKTGSKSFSYIQIIREFPLDSLPEREGLLDEVGNYFAWVWPFFKASTTGAWTREKDTISPPDIEIVDEHAPTTISELSMLTSLPKALLVELEQSLLAKQQVVLVGPPGTSKTYIAQQFARYFVRQRPGHLQGIHDVLYMHANWTYEDFFEGIKPATSKDGMLTFQSQKGFFLEWVEQLKTYGSSARHILVLDEINRCDTAAVLGELMQLLEYRGRTIRLLSGRSFAFPRNLYIIGTMNSADRSIGRMDLALRRRFLWLNLHSQPDTLQRWLDRVGNNPVGFKGSALAECNDLLAKRGIPREQHIGHALFMVQESDTDDENSVSQDIPLTKNHLHRIVQFSVLPYVRELFTTQFGQLDEDMIGLIRNTLLSCLNESADD